MENNQCIFCEIINKRQPAQILYEDEFSIAILDIKPIHFGHTLVIPKKHCTSFLDVPQESYQSILTTASIVTRALVKVYNLEGYNLFSNNGRCAGQSVFHFHLHITPRYSNDNIKFLLNLKEYHNNEIITVGQTLRQEIQLILKEKF